MVPLKRHKDPYLYLISTVIYTGARVAKPGQRRQVQGLVSQEFLGSNPIPRMRFFCVRVFLNFVTFQFFLRF